MCPFDFIFLFIIKINAIDQRFWIWGLILLLVRSVWPGWSAVCMFLWRRLTWFQIYHHLFLATFSANFWFADTAKAHTQSYRVLTFNIIGLHLASKEDYRDHHLVLSARLSATRQRLLFYTISILHLHVLQP